MPSPLAPQSSTDDSLLDSCTERCIESDSDLVEMIHACAAVVRPGSPARWCKRQNKASACEQAQICMQGVIANQDLPITGEAKVRLVLRTGLPSLVRPAECDFASDVEDEGLSFAAPLCERLNIDAIEYFVEGHERPKRYGCEAGLERGAEFTVKPGPVFAGARLQRNTTTDAGVPESHCDVYWGDHAFVVQAGMEITIPIFVPEGQLPPPSPDASCPNAADTSQ